MLETFLDVLNNELNVIVKEQASWHRCLNVDAFNKFCHFTNTDI